MEIKRKYRPTKFQREISESNIEVWMKVKEQLEDLMVNETSEDIKEYVTDAHSTIMKQIEDYNEIKSANRTRRGEFPIKRLRKRRYKMEDKSFDSVESTSESDNNQKHDNMVKEVRYKGQLIDPKDIEVTWSDSFGELHTDTIEDLCFFYASEELDTSLFPSGESW